MSISLRKVNEKTIVDIRAEKLDFGVVKTLRKTLNDLLSGKQYDILLNLSRVNSLECSAIGCVISAHKKCLRYDGQISIYGIQPDVLMILYIMQVDKYIEFYNNESDALYSKNLMIRRRFRVV